MKLKFSINDIILIFEIIFIVFSGFYLASLTKYSPVYFAFVVSLFIYIISPFKYKVNKSEFVVILFLIHNIVLFFFRFDEINTLINVVISLFVYVFILSKNDVLRRRVVIISKIFIYFTIVLLLIESIWRITHPIWVNAKGIVVAEQTEGNFYPFKLSSIMFQDSNFVGVYSSTMFFFVDYFTFDYKYLKITIKIILFVITLLTLSRAAVIAVLIVIFIKKIILSKKIKKEDVLLFLIPFFIITIYIVYSLISTDESFLSKFYIINHAVEYVKKSSFDTLLLGVGFGNAVKYLNIGSHNFIVTYLVESGIIGLFLILYFHFLFLKEYNFWAWDVVLVFFITGMSLVGHAVPFYYSQLALLVLMYKNKITTNEKI